MYHCRIKSIFLRYIITFIHYIKYSTLAKEFVTPDHHLKEIKSIKQQYYEAFGNLFNIVFAVFYFCF